MRDRSGWFWIFAVLIILMLAAMVAMGQTVGPQCVTTPTKTPTRTRTATSTATATATATATPTRTPTKTPTIPHSTPTPLPKCEDVGGFCGDFAGCPPGSVIIGQAADCQYCCREVTPTPTPVPRECGTACIPSFIVEGAYFFIPQLKSEHPWKVITILPSGWIFFREDGGDGREVWLHLSKVEALWPLYVTAVE